MAFGDSASLLDNFNRTNEGPPPSSSWTRSGWAGDGLKVVSNELQPNNMNTSCANYWNPATFGADCEVYATITDIDSTVSSINVQLRLTDTPSAATVDGYDFGVDTFDNVTKIKRIDNGIFNPVFDLVEPILLETELRLLALQVRFFLRVLG